MRKWIVKSVSLVLAVMLCLSLIPVKVLAVEGDFIIENGELTKYVGPGGDVVIPNGIISIGDYAFVGCDSVTSVTIPYSVTDIGWYAFLACINLTSVTIPESVSNIGYKAFAECKRLTSITIPRSITIISEQTFFRCYSLTSVTIPDSVKVIERYAFSACWNLESLEIPSSVTRIEAGAFGRCESLKSLKIPDGVTSIGDSTFYSCYSLKSVTIPDSVTSIGNRAFVWCDRLTSVTIPNSVTSIGVEAFQNCKKLTSVTMPASVTSIGNGAFHVTPGDNPAYEGTVGPESIIPNPNITFYGVAGSAAETYAKAQGIKFALPGTGSTRPTTNTPSTWASEAVNAAVVINLVPDDLQGNYQQAITRAEFAALAVTLYEQVMGKPILIAVNERKDFSDTTDVKVRKAATVGVVEGMDDGRGTTKFSPNSILTREEAATMLARLANATGKPLTKQAATFTDKGNISTWAADAVGQMQATGVMGGVGYNKFSPKEAYTREQSIMTILRLYNIVK